MRALKYGETELSNYSKAFLNIFIINFSPYSIEQ